MQYQKSTGIYLPNISVDKCANCKLCVEACSGFELDLTEYPEKDPALNFHELIGQYATISRAHSNNATRRENAPSGGMATEIVQYLMDSGKVDAAVLTRMQQDQPLKAEGFIAQETDEINQSQKSKYCPNPLNAILKKYVGEPCTEKLVFVGLPHHVHGLRLLQRIHPHLANTFPYVVSLFTAHVPSQRATEYILFKNDIAPESVKSIEYRGGGNPGRMKIATKDGSVVRVPHHHKIYYGHAFPLFFYPTREWLYFDKLSEWSDFSCGDNWMGGLAEQKGMSTVIARSAAASEIIGDMVESQKISARMMSAEDLVHDQTLVEKLNIRSRLKIWKMFGRKIPSYTRNFPKINSRWIATTRFGLYVMLCEKGNSFRFMNALISADYYLRAMPTKWLRLARKILGNGINALKLYSRPITQPDYQYKVVMIGGYGYKDIGDESMPHAARINLRKALGNKLELVMFSYDPVLTSETHGEKSTFDITRIGHSTDASLIIKLSTFFFTVFLLFAVLLEKRGIRLRLWSSARVALDNLSEANALLNVGGGNVNSIIPSEFYKKCTTYLIASILDVPVYLSGQTMGPFSSWFDSWYARLCLNKVKMISFRDKETSHSRLSALGVTEPIMFDAADDAISLQGIENEAGWTLLENDPGMTLGLSRDDFLIVMNIKASLLFFKGPDILDSLNDEVSLLAKMADALIDEYGCKVIFVATDFSDSVDDRTYHREVLEEICNRQYACSLENEYTDDELIGIISNSDIAIGGRYHFNVFAASRFIPFIGLSSGNYQRTKLQGLANLCALPQCYLDFDMGSASVEEVLPQVKQVVESRSTIHEQLIRIVPDLKTASRKVVNELVNNLQNSASS
jgi:coenzyme F420 hydrogenase subunit beta